MRWAILYSSTLELTGSGVSQTRTHSKVWITGVSTLTVPLHLEYVEHLVSVLVCQFQDLQTELYQNRNPNCCWWPRPN